MINNCMEWELKYTWNPDIYNIFKKPDQIDFSINRYNSNISVKINRTKDNKGCKDMIEQEEREAIRRAYLKDCHPFTPDEALRNLPGKEVKTASDKARCTTTAVNGDRVLAGAHLVTLEELLADYWFGYNAPCGERVK